MFFRKKLVGEAVLKEIYSKTALKRYLEFLIGIFIVAVTYNVLILPNNIVYGVGGIGVILKKIFNFDPAVTILVGDILLIILSFFTLDRKETRLTIIGSIVYPIMVKLTEPFAGFVIINTTDMLLLTIFGAVCTGFGHGLIFKSGFSTGGTDILNQIFAKVFKTSLGTAMIFTDGVIILSGVFIFGASTVMYSLIALYIISLLTDKVVIGISRNKAFYIVTEKPAEVKEFILQNISHGVTLIDARGGYSNDREKMLMCVIPTSMYFKLKEGIKYIDNSAFFVVTDAYETSGGSVEKIESMNK